MSNRQRLGAVFGLGAATGALLAVVFLSPRSPVVHWISRLPRRPIGLRLRMRDRSQPPAPPAPAVTTATKTKPTAATKPRSRRRTKVS